MRILIAEDDPVHRRFLEAVLLKWGYDVLSVPDGDEAWRILRRDDTPRLAVLDWVMPGMDGPQICREVRRLARPFYVYLLLLTIKAQKRDVVMGLEAGADDYLTKPFDPHELRARLRAGRRIVDLQEQLKSARELLLDHHGRDPLTGLWGRVAILDLLRRELIRAEHDRAHVGLLIADLDRFSLTYSTYGPMAADAVLREVARRILSAVRPYDSVGRSGADEFLIIVPACDAARATGVAERFRARIDRKAIDTSEGLVATTISLGVVACRPDRNAEPEQLIAAATQALARAKEKGGNCVELAKPENCQSAPRQERAQTQPADATDGPPAEASIGEGSSLPLHIKEQEPAP